MNIKNVRGPRGVGSEPRECIWMQEDGAASWAASS
jgi:hypothetical protein